VDVFDLCAKISIDLSEFERGLDAASEIQELFGEYQGDLRRHIRLTPG